MEWIVGFCRAWMKWVWTERPTPAFFISANFSLPFMPLLHLIHHTIDSVTKSQRQWKSTAWSKAPPSRRESLPSLPLLPMLREVSAVALRRVVVSSVLPQETAQAVLRAVTVLQTDTALRVDKGLRADEDLQAETVPCRPSSTSRVLHRNSPPAIFRWAIKASLSVALGTILGLALTRRFPCASSRIVPLKPMFAVAAAGRVLPPVTSVRVRFRMAMWRAWKSSSMECLSLCVCLRLTLRWWSLRAMVTWLATRFALKWIGRQAKGAT